MTEKKPKKLKYVPKDFVDRCSRMEQNDLIKELKIVGTPIAARIGEVVDGPAGIVVA